MLNPLKPLKVVVLFGGRSGEHEVSLSSARSVIQALDPCRYSIIPVGITREGAWWVGENALESLAREEYAGLRPATMLADPLRPGLWALAADDSTARLALLSEVDVVIPVLHGTFGEDGTLQGLLEMAGVAYVGAGVLSSAVAMDKIVFKEICRAQGLPVAEGIGVTRTRWEQEPELVLDEIEARLDYPIFTKPANLGSSVGITKCHHRAGLRRGIADAARYDRRVLVEAGVPDAREIEVSVLGNDEPVASLPGEIIPSREFYDYQAKYLDEGEEASNLLIPAPLDAALTARVQEIAVQIFRVIDGAGMARVDFLLSRETGELVLSEMNMIPGFTPISMYPKLWAATGLPYSALLDRLIELAVERRAENSRSERVYRPEKVLQPAR